MKKFVDLAYERINRAREELDKVITRSPDMNNDIKDTTSYLFHGTDYPRVSGHMENLFDATNVGSISNVDNNNVQVAGAPKLKNQDVVGYTCSKLALKLAMKLIRSCNMIIYCTKDRFVDRKNTQGQKVWVDNYWGYSTSSSSYDDCFVNVDKSNDERAYMNTIAFDAAINGDIRHLYSRYAHGTHSYTPLFPSV